MSDDVKKALERARLTREDHGFTQELGASVLITVLRRDDLDMLLTHIDGEPARQAAAVAAAREEQRKALLSFMVRTWNLAEVGHTESDAQKFEALLAEARATPLTATPLADELERAWGTIAKHVAERDAALSRVKELEAEVSRRDALIRTDGYEDMRQHAQELASRADEAERGEREAWRQTDAMRVERDAALERVKDLTDCGESKTDEACGECIACRDVTKADFVRSRSEALERVKELEAEKLALGVALIHAGTGQRGAKAVATLERLANAESERDALRAQLAEAVPALVGLTTHPVAKAGWSKSWDEAVDAARAFLAKHPEGK